MNGEEKNDPTGGGENLKGACLRFGPRASKEENGGFSIGNEANRLKMGLSGNI